MIDMGSIQAAVVSLKAATDIAKGIRELTNINDVQGKIAELRAEILSAQSSALAANSDQFALLQRVRDLEKEIADMEAWDAEAQRYILTEIATGVFTYTVKEEHRAGEPEHHLCTNCFNQRHKSILQAETHDVGRAQHYVCNRCGGDIIYRGRRQDAQPTRSRRR